jgi:hypothetical protein
MHFLHRINFAPHELCDAVVVCPDCAVWGVRTGCRRPGTYGAGLP